MEAKDNLQKKIESDRLLVNLPGMEVGTIRGAILDCPLNLPCDIGSKHLLSECPEHGSDLVCCILGMAMNHNLVSIGEKDYCLVFVENDFLYCTCARCVAENVE